MACVKDESVEIYGFQIHIGTLMIIGRQPKLVLQQGLQIW